MSETKKDPKARINVKSMKFSDDELREIDLAIKKKQAKSRTIFDFSKLVRRAVSKEVAAILGKSDT